jgi:glycosyltransferase involved in cell wall biosynthesis
MLDNETGILMEKGDEEEISTNVLYLLKHEEIRKRMGENAYLKTRDTLWENVAKLNSQIITHLIENFSEVLHHESALENNNL